MNYKYHSIKVALSRLNDEKLEKKTKARALEKKINWYSVKIH